VVPVCACTTVAIPSAASASPVLANKPMIDVPYG
jgi:hypothetical protein